MRLLMWVSTIIPLASAAAAEPVRLTTDGRWKQDPVFLKGGDELVYVDQPTAVQLRLVRKVLSTGATSPLHESETKNEYEPSFSPDGKWLAVVRSQGNLSLALVITELPDGKESRIDPFGGFCGYRSPAISPDGSKLLYNFADGGSQQIHHATIRGDDRKPLTNSRGVNNWPHWSADGQRIVFGSSRDDDYEIYVMKADGSQVQRLTDSPGQDVRPRFSPDGKRIAFTSNRDGNYEIYVMNAEGGGLRRVTDHPERDDYPVWHPDGRRLAWVAERQGRFDIVVMPLEESK